MIDTGVGWGLLFLVYIVPFSAWSATAGWRAYDSGKDKTLPWRVIPHLVGILVLYWLKTAGADLAVGVALAAMILLGILGHALLTRR